MVFTRGYAHALEICRNPVCYYPVCRRRGTATRADCSVAVWLGAARCSAAGLGQGLYSFVGYEAGEVWSPEARAILRQDGFAGLVANSPIGLFTSGVSVGDASHRKVFLTLERLF